jgi:hypothetical protein
MERCGRAVVLLFTAGLLATVLAADVRGASFSEEAADSAARLVWVRLSDGTTVTGRVESESDSSLVVALEDGSRITLPKITVVAVVPLPQQPELAEVRLSDGTSVVASAVDARGDTLHITTPAGVRMAVPQSLVTGGWHLPASGQARPAQSHEPVPDPSYSRLMLAPTGRPLAAGDGYVSDHYVLFPSYARGITNNISLMGGLSVFPAVGLMNQLRYVAPRVAHAFSEDVAACAGGVLAGAGSGEDGGGIGMLFGMATFGKVERSLTMGLGYGWARDSDETHYLGGPIIAIGGSRQLSENVSLVSESWIITGEGLGLDQQPFGLALRFFSGGLAVDAGAVLVGEALKHGFPIPWLSFAYHLGS